MLNFKNIFRKKSKLEKESSKALKYIRKLFKIRIVKIVLAVTAGILLSPFIVFILLRPKIQEDINYGVTFSKKYATQLGLDWKKSYIQILDDLNTKNIRLIAYWDDVEKIRDVYNFSDIKWQLDEAQKRGINVIMTVGRKVPRYPECFEPEWWKGIQSENIRNQELYEYIKEIVKTSKNYPVISMWQIENEPFFPFGECRHPIRRETVKEEIEIVRSLDERPILVQDSGEGGFWFPSYRMGDYLAISMYRKIWYDFWGVFAKRFIYFKYPLAHWTYKIKADLVRVPYERIIVTELQGEPWGPAINSQLSEKEKNRTMSRNDFLSTLSYAQKAGFKDIYIWGVEWWLWEKTFNNNPFYWDTAKALFR